MNSRRDRPDTLAILSSHELSPQHHESLLGTRPVKMNARLINYFEGQVVDSLLKQNLIRPLDRDFKHIAELKAKYKPYALIRLLDAINDF